MGLEPRILEFAAEALEPIPKIHQDDGIHFVHQRCNIHKVTSLLVMETLNGSAFTHTWG